MLQAMNTGHDGSMGTLHANSPREALTRLENMVGMAGVNLPAKAMRTQIAAAVHLIAAGQPHARRRPPRSPTSPRWSAWRATSITMQDLFTYEYRGRGPPTACCRAPSSPPGLRPHFMPASRIFRPRPRPAGGDADVNLLDRPLTVVAAVGGARGLPAFLIAAGLAAAARSRSGSRARIAGRHGRARRAPGATRPRPTRSPPADPRQRRLRPRPLIRAAAALARRGCGGDWIRPRRLNDRWRLRRAVRAGVGLLRRAGPGLRRPAPLADRWSPRPGRRPLACRIACLGAGSVAASDSSSAQFPEAIDLIVRGVRSGLPVAEALQRRRPGDPRPGRRRVPRGHRHVKLGKTLDESLGAGAGASGRRSSGFSSSA